MRVSFPFVLSTLSACVAGNNPQYLGVAVEPSQAHRTIEITSDTASVNVTRGDDVKFVVGDKVFAWNFNCKSDVTEFDLRAVAPEGVLGHSVKAYIARTPDYDLVRTYDK